MARTDRLQPAALALAILLVHPSAAALADDVNVSIGTLPAGKTVMVRFGARIANPVPPGVAQVSFQGTVSGTNFPATPTDDPDTGAVGDATVTPLTGADLSVTKSGLPDPVFPGATLTYTITVTNAGPEPATLASLVDVLPPDTTFQSLTAPAGWTSTTPPVGGVGQVTCSHPSLPVSTSVFTLVVGVDASVAGGASIVNTATVSSLTADPNPGNEAASSTVTVAGSFDLAITKTDSGPVFPGSDVVYRLVVTNNGPDAATGVSVADPTPAGLTFVANALDCTSPFPCSLGSLAPGETRTISATFRVPAGYPGPDPIVNTATVSAATPDLNGANDTASVETPVNLPANGLAFHTLSPCRLLDTRNAPGPLGGPALRAREARTFRVAGVCGIPPTAKVLSVNVTVTQGSTLGHVLIYSSGPPPPIVSSTTNYAPLQTRGNNAIVSLNRDGEISVYVVQGSGTLHFILDVNGYFE
jgi:uncharacterized repeat protein (TIGR01451 family)